MEYWLKRKKKRPLVLRIVKTKTSVCQLPEIHTLNYYVSGKWLNVLNLLEVIVML